VEALLKAFGVCYGSKVFVFSQKFLPYLGILYKNQRREVNGECFVLFVLMEVKIVDRAYTLSMVKKI